MSDKLDKEQVKQLLREADAIWFKLLQKSTKIDYETHLEITASHIAQYYGRSNGSRIIHPAENDNQPGEKSRPGKKPENNEAMLSM